jgi:hypothetical protein
MNYEIRLMPDAESDLNRLAVWLRERTESHLTSLSNHPSVLSRPSVSPPYPPGGMISEVCFESGDGVSHYITVFFLYGQDETSLIVTRIGHVRY